MKQHTVIKNSLITAGILGAATGFCFLIQEAAESDTHVPLLFVLAVLFISRFTDGYIYGIVASMIAVVGVNYVFTYPYFAIDFTITGYPVTFIAMLAVACSVSALTTQIKKQEQIRLEAEKEKMRGNLLRAVSHDIRTPLTSIMGAASVVLENYGELSDEKRMDFLKDIREESQWLIQIVENLLSITRIGDNGGSASIDKQEEMVEEIVGSAVLKFRKRYPDVEVAVRLPEDPLLVPMDGILIEQVLVNLMENSVLHGKHTSKVEVSAEEEKDRVVFYVDDDGAGIRPSALPKMFEGTFRQGDEEKLRFQTEYGHRSFGVHEHHPGPPGRYEGRKQERGRSQAELLASHGKRYRSVEIKDRILVVEDDKRISSFFKTVLESNRYDVIMASTGSEAYSLITSQCPDLVILDLGLPDMDGMNILRSVRE